MTLNGDRPEEAQVLALPNSAMREHVTLPITGVDLDRLTDIARAGRFDVVLL